MQKIYVLTCYSKLMIKFVTKTFYEKTDLERFRYLLSESNDLIEIEANEITFIKDGTSVSIYSVERV